MPVAVGIVPGVRRRNVGDTDDCDRGERNRERSQEMRERSRIARRSGRHAVPPSENAISDQDNGWGAPAYPLKVRNSRGKMVTKLRQERGNGCVAIQCRAISSRRQIQTSTWRWT